MVKSADIEEIKQKVEEDIGKELNLSPKRIRNYGTSNIFSRAFSYLFGWTIQGKPIKLRATKTGNLKVASSGASFEETKKISGTTPATGHNLEDFTFAVGRVLIYTKHYDILLKPSPDGQTYYDEVRCLAGNTLELDLVVKKFEIRNEDGNKTDYEVVGFR